MCFQGGGQVQHPNLQVVVTGCRHQRPANGAAAAHDGNPAARSRCQLDLSVRIHSAYGQGVGGSCLRRMLNVAARRSAAASALVADAKQPVDFDASRPCLKARKSVAQQTG